MNPPEFGEPRYALRDDGVIKRCVNAQEVEDFARGHSVTLTTKNPECDFCSRVGEAEYREFPCRNFTVMVGGRQHESLGAWSACSICAGLIDAGDREGLAERCVARLLEPAREMPPEMREQFEEAMRQFVAVLHDAFYRHRVKEAHERNGR